MQPPPVIAQLEAAVDAVLDAVPGDVVLGIPLAIGKPNLFVNALYRRVKAQPGRRLTIVTALSLERPVDKSHLKRHFLAPLVERVFGDYPDLDYVKDARGAGLPLLKVGVISHKMPFMPNGVQVAPGFFDIIPPAVCGQSVMRRRPAQRRGKRRAAGWRALSRMWHARQAPTNSGEPR